MRLLIKIFFLALIMISTRVVASEDSPSKYYKLKTDNKKLALILNDSVNLKKTRDIKKIEAEIQQNLTKNGYFLSSLKISDGLIYILNPVKWDFFFEGNYFYSRHFLKKSLKSSSVSSSLESLLPELEQGLVKIYKKAGFHFVQVKSEFKQSKDNLRSRLVFKITENAMVKIKRIQFTGDFPGLKKSDLLKRLKKYSNSQISKGIYTESSLVSGLISLKNDLHNLGFFNAYVGLEKLKFNNQKNKVSLGVKVYTNSPTKISKVVFSGNKNISDFWLNELLNIQPEDTLNLYKFEEGLNLIEDYYLQRGFLKVSVEKDQNLTYSKDLKTARIDIAIVENEQTIVSKINIRGNLKTKNSIILREINFQPGEVLTADKIKDSISSLTRLGFFSNIKINPLFEERTDLGTPVEILISERKSGAFTVGFGLSSELGFTAKTFAGFDYKNINGTARAFTSRAELKRNLKDINKLENRIFGSYVEPYLFETDIKGRVNLSRNDEVWDIDSENDQVTTILSNRFDLILEKELTEHTTLYFSPFSLDIRGEKVFDENLDNKLNEIEEVIANVGSTVQFDFRNNPFLPTKGSLSKIQIEYASPLLGSNTKSALDDGKKFDLEFLKVQGSYSFYRPLAKRLILAQSFRGGYLHNYSDVSSEDANGKTVRPFPKSRAFFLGGSTTIRGFDPSKSNERIPNDRYLEGNGGIFEGNTVGGGVLNIPNSSYYYLTKTELRFPLSKDSSWWGAVFYDGGSVQITSLTEDYEPWRHSIGIGFRFNTPVGPLLNAEIAYKLDRNTDPDIDESAIQFHLSVSSF